MHFAPWLLRPIGLNLATNFIQAIQSMKQLPCMTFKFDSRHLVLLCVLIALSSLQALAATRLKVTYNRRYLQYEDGKPTLIPLPEFPYKVSELRRP